MAIALVIAAGAIGFGIGDLTSGLDSEARLWFRVHFLLGVGAALAVVFVNSIVVTYFIGTGRWVREVSETYQLDARYLQRSTLLKRRAFPWAVLSMTVVIVVIALGAATDPGSAVDLDSDWHLAAAIGSLILIMIAAFFQWRSIGENQAVIHDVMSEVSRIRAARGLPVDEQYVA